MPERDSAHTKGKHVSQPLVAEYDSVNDIDEPVSAGAWRPVVSASAAAGGTRFDDYSREKSNYSAPKKKSGLTATKVLAALLTVFLVGVLGYAGFQFFKSSYKESVNEQLRPENIEDAQAAKQVLTPTTSRDPFYMMIIGTDSRNDEMGERSDTNIVARIDPQRGIISMISIPRDTAIMLEGYGTQKFNAAFAYGGIPGAIRAAEGLLGVQISHYALVDFDGMKALVDALGGVTVDVPVRIDDPDAGPVVVEAGEQHLDGEHALVFARSRAYTTGDFQRTTNQRLLISAMLNQAMNISTTDLPRIIESAAQCLTTDMTVNMIQDYALYFMDHENITVYSTMVPSSTAMNEGSSYVVCDTAALLQVMQAIDSGEDPSPYVADYTVSTSQEAAEAGMPDAIGVDSRLTEGDGTGDANAGYGY
ncbi:MAG: LCP family protein [Eggerthellaceae bacterium]|nr:LCP family protein [Eggerthellaceae bacterium]